MKLITFYSRIFGIFFFTLISAACGKSDSNQSPSEQNTSDSGESSSAHIEATPPSALDNKIGWIHGPCLAIKNQNIQTGAKLKVVILDYPKTLTEATVKGVVTEESDCPALGVDLATINKQDGRVYYTIELTDKGLQANNSNIMGLGITTAQNDAASGSDPAMMASVGDVNGDGSIDVASSCLTDEGFNFNVRSKGNDQSVGELLWSDNYYKGFLTKAKCP